MTIEIIAILGIFLTSAALIWLNFDLSIYLLLVLSVLLHKELFSFFQWDLLPVRGFVFALLCVFMFRLAHSLLKKNTRQEFFTKYFRNPVFIFLVALWAINGISIVYSLNLKASILQYGFFTTSTVLFICLVTRLRQSEELALKYIKFYVNTAFVLTLFGFFQYYLYASTGKIIGSLWNIPGNIPRIGSTFWDVNHYGAFLAALLPVSCVLVLVESKWKKKIWYGIVSLSLLISLFLTNSRTAWIIDLVALVFFGLLFLIRKFGAKGILYVVIPLVLLASVLGFEYSIKNGVFRADVKQYLHYRIDSSDSHILLLQGAYEIFTKYPILGGGYGGFFEHFNNTKVAPTYFGRDPAAFNTRVPAHTIWGELLSESGSLGFAAFVLFITSVIGVLVYGGMTLKGKRFNMLNASMASVLIGWMVAGIFYSYNSEFFWILLALFFAYGCSTVLKDKNYKDILKYFSSSAGFIFSLILVLALIIIFWSLGTNHLIPWDEAIYAKIAKNMVVTGNYIFMKWKPGVVWYEKPPLYMWMMAGLMKLIGFSSWAVKIPSALFGFGTVLVVFKFSQKLFGKTAAYISALCLLTTTQFLYYARVGMLDVTTTFFIVSALYIYYCYAGSKNRSLWLITGVFIGLATMTKGVIGLIPFPIIFLSEWLVKKRFEFKSYLIMLLGWSIIALPWHLVMWYRYGFAFWKNYIGYHVLDRAVTAIEDKGNPFWWYLIVIKVSMRLWAIALLGAIPLAIASLKKNKHLIFLFLSFIFVLLLFSAAQSKLVWYIIPIYPFAAMLNGYFFSWTFNFIAGKLKRIDPVVTKTSLLFSVTMVVLIYFFLNLNLVYVGDLTGSQANLMQLKDSVLGTKSTLYLDRIELPLALYYTDSPFEIIDFLPTDPRRVPRVDAQSDLVLLTKTGRFSESVAGYSYTPTVVSEDGDYVLWYFRAKGTDALR